MLKERREHPPHVSRCWVPPLPGHFTPDCLRHTFASLRLQQGESAVYVQVQRQLGHASIQLSVDLYGRWLPRATKPPSIGWTGRVVASGGLRGAGAQQVTL